MSVSIQGDGGQQQSEGLISGLPDDLAVLCLVRVPRRDHATLRCVCRGWNWFVGSTKFLDLRKSMGLAEGWLYALSRGQDSKCLRLHAMDPKAGKWLPLPAMPEASGLERYGTSCSVLGRRVFIMGGCDKYEYPTNEVLCYDAAANAWSTEPPLQVARCHFVTAQVGDKLYAIGGMGPTAGALNSWEVLDDGDEGHRWKLYDDDPNVVSDLGEALVVDRRIYVRHASPIPPAHGAPYAAVFDTGDRTWKSLDDELSRQWCGPAVQVGGEVYMLDQNQGIKLMVLEDVEAAEWSAVGRLSPRSIRTPCRIAAIGRELFVVGRGLQTMVLNLDKASRARGLLVTSSIEGLPPESSHDIVVSCNVLEL